MDYFFKNWFQHRESGEKSTTTEASTEHKKTISYEDNVNRVNSQDRALTIAAVYRAIEIRMKMMSQVEFEFQSWDKQRQYYAKATYGADRRMNYLLQVQPNPMMSAKEFWQQSEFNKISYGNAFVYIQRDSEGWPYWMWLCDGYGSYDPLSGKYTLSYLGEHGQVNIIADKADVLHVPNTYKYYGTNMGIPTLVYARETLTLQATNRGQALDNTAKGGRMKLIVGEEKPATAVGTAAFGMINKKFANDYAKELNDLWYSGQDVLAIRGLDKVIPISMNAQQLQLLEQMNFGIPEVSRYYGVQKPLLMDDSNSSYKTPDQAMQAFLSGTIAPSAEEWVAEITRKTLTPLDYGAWRYEAKIGNLFKFDRKATSDINKMKIETGVASPNELRMEANMPRIEGGDTYFVSANLKPVQDVLTPPVQPQEPTTNGGEGAEGGDE